MNTFFKYVSGGKTATFKPYRLKEQTFTDLNTFTWEHYVEIFHADKSNFIIQPRYEIDQDEKLKLGADLKALVTEVDIIDDIIAQENEIRTSAGTF